MSKRILYFFLATFTLTGVLFAIQVVFGITGYVQLPMYGPALGTVLFLSIEKRDIAHFFKSRFAPKMNLPVLLLVALPIAVHAAISYWTQRYWGLANVIDLSRDTQAKVLYIVAMIPAVFGEEIGWRGYLLPRLQERFSPLISTLVVGVMWAAWHIPTKLVSPTFFLFWFIELQGFNFLFTCVHNRGGSSIWPSVLLHYVLDISGFLLIQQGVASIPVMGLSWLTVGLLVLTFDWKRFAAKPAVEQSQATFESRMAG